MSSRHRKIAAIISAILLSVGVFIYFRETEFKTKANQEVNTWLQVVTGNWSPDNPYAGQSQDGYTKDPLLFSLAALTAIVVNLGQFVLLFQIVTTLLDIRRKRDMRLIDLIRHRDRAIKNSIIRLFPDDVKAEIMTKLDEGFAEGADIWENEELNIIAPGRRRADKLREAIKTATIEPK